jgi:hypothetical protein
MIRRCPPRPRGQHQDFHFFAAGDPIANIESQFRRASQPAHPQPAIQSESPSRLSRADAREESIATEGPHSSRANTETASPSPAASSAIRESIEFLARIDDPRDLIGKPRPAFMDELDALAASRPNAPGKPSQESALSKPPKSQRTPKRRGRSTSSQQSSASRHERRCTICSHPDCAEIEADFVEWAQPSEIAREYDVTRNSVYRHARAAGLFPRRNRNLRFALGRLIESVDSVQPTADSIVRAIHSFARINDEGQWVEPPAHVIVSSGGVRREAAAPPSRRPVAIRLDSPALTGFVDVAPDSETQPALIGTPERLERNVNH